MYQAFSGLATNKALTKLDITANSIGDEGAIALSAALAKNTTLTSLSWDENNITYKGFNAFRECLKTNKTLIEVSPSDVDSKKLLDSFSKANKDSIMLESSIRRKFRESL
jgi:hypothetical protein